MAGNRYDSSDIVRRVYMMNADGLKFASYRVRDMVAATRGEEVFSSLQHHLTYVPLKSLGQIGGVENVLVNEIGATIYAMLDDAHIDLLREAIAEVEAMGDSVDTQGVQAADGSDTWVHFYPHPDTVEPEFQIHSSGQILGVLGLGTAKLFCTLAENARSGLPSRANVAPPQGTAEAIAGEVDRTLKTPAEQLEPAGLDEVN